MGTAIKKMKAAIYNPYFDTQGGGELYTIVFAKVLTELGYVVDISWDDPDLLKKLTLRFGIKLKRGINVVPNIGRGEGYELCFWVSDGSIPTLRAKRNIIHFQVPFKNVNGKSLLNKMKLFRVSDILCNSHFTKNIIDKEYGVKSLVLYPPVNTNYIKPKRKENMILYVGRFSKLVQSKKQDVLIDTFKKLVRINNLNNWELILAGGTEIGSGGFINELKKKIGRLPVRIIESPDFDTIKDLYGKSKFFWAAAGFNEDEVKNPQNFEHFGISTVESMAAGVVPLCFDGGGYREIIESSKNGFLWQNTKGLLQLTKQLIEDSKLRSKIAKAAKLSTNRYSLNIFKENIVRILK